MYREFIPWIIHIKNKIYINKLGINEKKGKKQKEGIIHFVSMCFSLVHLFTCFFFININSLALFSWMSYGVFDNKFRKRF